MHEHSPDTADEPLAHWEARYAGAAPIWSGAVNATTADVLESMPPGRALDLGCGEGGDAIWLAGRGWRVTGVDISPTATARGAAAADAAGVADRIAWIAADLADWVPDGGYDLVTASFLHSTVALPRTAILRRAASAVVPGGHLLIVSHAAPPPWHRPEDHDHGPHRDPLRSPEEELVELALPADDWVTVLAETRRRRATGPDGAPAHLDDGVLLLRRVAAV